MAGCHRSDASKVRDTYLKAIALAANLLKETPKDEYLLADVGEYYAAVGKETSAQEIVDDQSQRRSSACAQDQEEGPKKGGGCYEYVADAFHEAYGIVV